MRTNKLNAIAMLLLACQLPVLPVALAESDPVTPQSQSDARRRWSELSEGDKQRLRENYRRWKAMPEERRAELRKNFARFRSLSPERRQRVVQNFRRFQQLSPERKQKLKLRFQKFKQLPPEERQRRIQMWKKRAQERRHQTPPPAKPRFQRRQLRR